MVVGLPEKSPPVMERVAVMVKGRDCGIWSMTVFVPLTVRVTVELKGGESSCGLRETSTPVKLVRSLKIWGRAVKLLPLRLRVARVVKSAITARLGAVKALSERSRDAREIRLSKSLFWKDERALSLRSRVVRALSWTRETVEQVT